MPKKQHDPKTAKKIAARPAAAAAPPPKVLTPGEEEALLCDAMSEAGIRGILHQPSSVLFPETMQEVVEGITSKQIHRFDPASVVTMLGYDTKSSLKDILQALFTCARMGFNGGTLIASVRRGTQVQNYFFDTVPEPSIVKSPAHQTLFYSLLEGQISTFLRSANIIVREFPPGAHSSTKYLKESCYPLVKSSSAAAASAPSVLEGLPETMAQVVALFARGKTTYFDAEQGAAFLNSLNLKSMSSSDLKMLTDKLGELSSRAVNLFCPSSGLIYFKSDTKEQTYVFVSTLDPSTEANPTEEEDFYKFLQEDIAAFLAKIISVPGTIVIREFAPRTRQLLPDFTCSFSPRPVADLSLPASLDSSAASPPLSDAGRVFSAAGSSALNDGFGRGDSDSDDDLIFEPGTASHERARAFRLGALEPIASGPLQLSAYLKDPASEQNFKDQLGKLSEALGICYDRSSTTTLLFDDPPFAGDFNFVPRLSEEALEAKEAEFSAKLFDESFFQLMFAAFLSEVACGLCKQSGRIRISLPRGQFEGAFDPSNNKVSIRFKASEPKVLDRGVPGIPVAATSSGDTVYNDLSSYIVEPYRSQLARAFYDLRDFIIKTAGVTCSIRIGDTLFKFGTKKPIGSMTSQQRLRIKMQIDSLLNPIKQCLQNSTKEAIVSVWYEGGKPEIVSIKPGITSAAGAGSSASEAAAVAPVDLQAKWDGLQRDLAMLQEQLATERASILFLLNALQLKQSGSEEELARRLLSGIKAQLERIEKQAPALRAHIMAEGDTHTALAAKLASLEAEVSALRTRLLAGQQELHTLQKDRLKLEADVKSAQSGVVNDAQTCQRLSLVLTEAKAQLAERQQAAAAASARQSTLDAERAELLRLQAALIEECEGIEAKVGAVSAQTSALKTAAEADLMAVAHLQGQWQQQAVPLSAAAEALRLAKCQERDLMVSAGRSVDFIPNPHGEYVQAFAVQGSEPWEGFVFVGINEGGIPLQCLATVWATNHGASPSSSVAPSL